MELDIAREALADCGPPEQNGQAISIIVSTCFFISLCRPASIPKAFGISDGQGLGHS